MKLCWASYNEKRVLFLILEQFKNKISALKVQEENGPVLLSDKSIEKIKSKENRHKLKSIIPEFKNTFRTYNLNNLKVIRTYDL